MTRPPVMRVRRGAPEKRVQWEIRRELQKLGCEVCDLTQPRATIPSMPAGRNCSPGGAQ
ncbi:MAG TPA: hypothetical protein VIK91_19380 [Nannocystis sp.]